MDRMPVTETPNARAAPNRGGTNDTDVTKELPLRSHLFGYIQRYSITKYHSLLIVFESIVSTARLRREPPARYLLCSRDVLLFFTPGRGPLRPRAGGPKQI